jgi:hypothetical protein
MQTASIDFNTLSDEGLITIRRRQLTDASVGERVNVLDRSVELIGSATVYDVQPSVVLLAVEPATIRNLQLDDVLSL